MYLFYPDASQADRCNNGVLSDLDVWLYRHWFKPYESDIEHGRYIAKSIYFRHHTADIEPTLTDISEFHHRLVQSLSPDAFKSVTSQMLQELRIVPFRTTAGQPQEEPFATLSKSHKVPPLFKSLFIVVHQTQVSRTERFTVEETDNIPVTLVQSGSMEGLKYPISFHSLHRNGGVLSEHNPSGNSVCSVRTNVKSAIRFVLDLEKREERFWGTKPRPLADSSVDVEKEARELGWDDATHGKLPLDQPSPTWVNRREYPDWTGPGALHHLRLVRVMMHLRRYCPEDMLEDDWWWWKIDDESPETGIMGLIYKGASFFTTPRNVIRYMLLMGNLIVHYVLYILLDG
ncbi:hypothetical protein FBULB1_12972 [Fusarium bulbicola]|nr:hypothetical protein FBULB1_12972 [Fusarium bulbicola]